MNWGRQKVTEPLSDSLRIQDRSVSVFHHTKNVGCFPDCEVQQHLRPQIHFQGREKDVQKMEIPAWLSLSIRKEKASTKPKPQPGNLDPKCVTIIFTKLVNWTIWKRDSEKVDPWECLDVL
jgi:hypothetical protein